MCLANTYVYNVGNVAESGCTCAHVQIDTAAPSCTGNMCRCPKICLAYTYVYSGVLQSSIPFYAREEYVLNRRDVRVFVSIPLYVSQTPKTSYLPEC